MKLIILTTLITALSLSCAVQARDGLFRPAFNKTLKRMGIIKPGGLQRHLAQHKHKTTVFVDLRTIFWGDEEEFAGETEQRDEFGQIVRQLKEGIAAYGKRYNVRVRLVNQGSASDVTKHFLNWLDVSENTQTQGLKS